MYLTKFTLYETKSRFYIVGSNQSQEEYRIGKIEKLAESQVSLVDDSAIYNRIEINELLQMISNGNKVNGGLKKVMDFCGIFGFVRFLETYYLILITEKSPVALVGGHYIYHIDNIKMIPIGSNSKAERKRVNAEQRYCQIFAQVDMTKNFYFSYSYDLTRSLQDNLTMAHVSESESEHKRFKRSEPNRMFLWNDFLTKGFLNHDSCWFLPIIYGFVDQSKISVFGHNILITLIARRSRYFAGARFLKRGVSEQGYVANDVETEQIVNSQDTTTFCFPVGKRFNGIKDSIVDNPSYTSFLQHRGSIPLFWGQDTASMAAKPVIQLNFVDPFYTACAKHFDNLFLRYGKPVIVLNLVKAKEKTKRESILLEEFTNAVNYLNQSLGDDEKIEYIKWDMARASKSADQDVVTTLENLAKHVLERVGFFHSGSQPFSNALRDAKYVNLTSETGSFDVEYSPGPRYQQGILRTNCIDCLDRTNAAQFMVGKCALGLQLHALGIIPHPEVQFDSDACNIFNAMYHDHGDTIALQYGGSHLVNTMETYRKMSAWTSHSRDMIERIRRYYSNLITDAEKQDAINLFLGYFIPSQSDCELWDLQSDFSLHNLPPGAREPIDSYIKWWNQDHILNNQLARKLNAQLTFQNIDLSHNQLQEYYNPRSYTSLDKLFAFRIMSTSNGANSFTPRINPSAPSKSLIIYNLNIGGVREWLRPVPTSQKSNEKPPLPIKTLERSNSSKTVGNSDSGVFIPVVKISEQKEYFRYLHQFKHAKSPFSSEFQEDLESREQKISDHPDYNKFLDYIQKPEHIHDPEANDMTLYDSMDSDAILDSTFGSLAITQEEMLTHSYQRWFDTGVYTKERHGTFK